MSEELKSMLSKIAHRRDGQREWLKENSLECFTEQKHLEEGSQERVYWHYGYMVALTDILRLLGDDQWIN